MEDQTKQWQALCEEAAKEKDPERLMSLVKEISRLLDNQLNQKAPRDAA